jgi:hypothetical protein
MLAAAFAATVSSGAAFAADIPSKAPAAPPPPVVLNGFDFAIGGKIMSDYVSRGASQSSQGPAVTAYGEARYNIGDTQLYAGVQGWSVQLPTSPSMELDLYAGVRQTWGKFTVDVGGIWYWYPSNKNQYWLGPVAPFVVNSPGVIPGPGFLATTARDPSFGELYIKPSFAITDSFTVGATGYYSPNWNHYGFDSFYLSGTAKYAFGDTGLSISGEFGRQWLGTTAAASIFGTFTFPDYNSWNVGVSYNWKVFTVDARYYGSNLSRAGCYALTSDPGGNFTGTSKWCGDRFMVSLAADITAKDLGVLPAASPVLARY